MSVTLSLRRRSILAGGLKLGVSTLLTWLALRHIDLAQALHLAAGLSLPLAVCAMLLLVSQILLSAWRWVLVSRQTTVTLRLSVALRFFMISLFYNQTLPSTIPGDGARIWGAARGGGKMEAAVTVFLDRLLTLLALSLLAGVSAVVLFFTDAAALILSIPLLVLGLVFAMLAVLVIVRRHVRSFVPGRVADFAVQLGDALHRLAYSPDIASLGAISLLIHGISIAAVWILALGMGLQLTLWMAFIAVPLVLMAALIPVSVNGWGVREGAMVLVLTHFSIGRAEAATLSVIYGLFQLVLGLAGGLFVVFPERGESAKSISGSVISSR